MNAQWLMKSKIGNLYLVASDKGLQGVLWKQRPKVEMLKALEGSNPAILILKRTEKQLTEYFAGKRKEFDLPFDIVGTEFQKEVWNQLSKIPFGTTCSYRDIAEKLKRGKAFRAVGTANGKNPISIIVPCHRVIAADGTLGGYAGGLPIKTELLTHEKSKFKK